MNAGTATTAGEADQTGVGDIPPVLEIHQVAGAHGKTVLSDDLSQADQSMRELASGRGSFTAGRFQPVTELQLKQIVGVHANLEFRTIQRWSPSDRCFRLAIGRMPLPAAYCNFAYSALASFNGMRSGAASFQSTRKS